MRWYLVNYARTCSAAMQCGCQAHSQANRPFAPHILLDRLLLYWVFLGSPRLFCRAARHFTININICGTHVITRLRYVINFHKRRQAVAVGADATVRKSAAVAVPVLQSPFAALLATPSWLLARSFLLTTLTGWFRRLRLTKRKLKKTLQQITKMGI